MGHHVGKKTHSLKPNSELDGCTTPRNHCLERLPEERTEIPINLEKVHTVGNLSALC